MATYYVTQTIITQETYAVECDTSDGASIIEAFNEQLDEGLDSHASILLDTDIVHIGYENENGVWVGVDISDTMTDTL